MIDEAQRCGMCLERDMTEVSQKSEVGVLLMCPNCDSPAGKMPQINEEEEAAG